MQPGTNPSGSAGQGVSTEVDETGRLDAPRSEAILIRSYDHQWAYDLDVEVLSGAGQRLFQERYYLLPGHVESESGVAPSGQYTVHVTLDNEREHVTECRLGRAPEHTLVIEVGNGTLSLTEGVDASR